MVETEILVGGILLFGVVPCLVLFLLREAVIGWRERKKAKIVG
jgi:hypothetical protein